MLSAEMSDSDGFCIALRSALSQAICTHVQASVLLQCLHCPPLQSKQQLTLTVVCAHTLKVCEMWKSRAPVLLGLFCVPLICKSLLASHLVMDTFAEKSVKPGLGEHHSSLIASCHMSLSAELAWNRDSLVTCCMKV